MGQCHYLNLGLSASRNQSPNKFTLKASANNVQAGKNRIHHSPENRKPCPIRISVPSDGCVGGAPTPRNDSVASAMIANASEIVAIIAEATLSFLGVGAPPTQPSLGTLIRIGQGFLFSGEWWILFFPAVTLLVLALSVNLLGDWLRDALNPRLR